MAGCNDVCGTLLRHLQVMCECSDKAGGLCTSNLLCILGALECGFDAGAEDCIATVGVANVNGLTSFRAGIAELDDAFNGKVTAGELLVNEALQAAACPVSGVAALAFWAKSAWLRVPPGGLFVRGSAR